LLPYFRLRRSEACNTMNFSNARLFSPAVDAPLKLLVRTWEKDSAPLKLLVRTWEKDSVLWLQRWFDRCFPRSNKLISFFCPMLYERMAGCTRFACETFAAPPAGCLCESVIQSREIGGSCHLARNWYDYQGHFCKMRWRYNKIIFPAHTIHQVYTHSIFCARKCWNACTMSTEAWTMGAKKPCWLFIFINSLSIVFFWHLCFSNTTAWQPLSPINYCMQHFA
jgi:hypothetical protein